MSTLDPNAGSKGQIDNNPQKKPAEAAQSEAAAPASSPPETTQSEAAAPAKGAKPRNANLATIMAAFLIISDRMEKKLETVKERLDLLHKKIDRVKKDMNAASVNAANLASRGEGKTAYGVNTGLQARGWTNYDPKANAIHIKDLDNKDIIINDNTQAPDKMGKKGGEEGFTKEQWTSINTQCQEKIKSVETHVKTISSDLGIEVQRWQTFSGQFLKAVEQMSNDMQKISNISVS